MGGHGSGTLSATSADREPAEPVSPAAASPQDSSRPPFSTSVPPQPPAPPTSAFGVPPSQIPRRERDRPKALPTHGAPVESARESRAANAQSAWALRPLSGRLGVLARARALVAEAPERLTDAISPALSRTPADTLVAEVLPFLAACRFLERSAAGILTPRRLGREGRPFWLPGVSHRVERVPLGRVLVIAPGNYPLFLPGVQVVQALAGGNSVVWKPGRGGEPVARALASLLAEAGLPPDLLHVTDESVGAAERAITSGADKIFLTGSAESGRKVLARAAETLTPVVAELSGCDAVIVLPDADLDRVVNALAFGMRLNGSATCMAPRRLILVDSTPDRRRALVQALVNAFRRVPATRLAAPARGQLHDLLEKARSAGATIHAELTQPQQPILVSGGNISMELAQTDIFAPVLTLIEVASEEAALAAEAATPFALTCSIFGKRRRAQALAGHLRCGTVVINDLIAPTADPRVPFGGRRQSGFGVTRGAEGLLEMTAVRVVTTRRSRGTRHFEPTNTAHESLFRALSRAGYAQSWQSRMVGARAILRAVRGLGDPK